MRFNQETEKFLKEEMRSRFQQVFDSGLKQGCTAMCGIVLKRATAKKQTDEQRVASIKEFCQQALGVFGDQEMEPEKTEAAEKGTDE